METECSLSLVDLPNYILRPIFFEWIWSRDLCMFDKSVCQIIQIIRGCRICGDDIKLHKQSYLTWIIIRRIDITHLELECDYAFNNENFEDPDIQLALKNVVDFGVSFGQFYSGIFDVKEAEIPLMNVFSSKLSNLRINDCVIMKPKDFHFIANKCPNLTSLNLESCFSLTDECIADLTLKCNKLRNLNISNTITLSDVSIDSIGLHCPQLTSLAFGFEANAAFQDKVQLTSASVVVLSRRCSNLIELAVTNTLLSDAAFVALITANKSLKSITLISNFNMQGEAVLAAIAVNCRGLQKLKLETVERFNSLARVAVNCRELRDLSVLYMRCDDNEMHMLLQSCRRLESFALAYRHGNTLTDVTVSNIVKHCPRITQLSIAGVAYTVEGLQSIIASQVAVNLNLLDLSYNNTVDDLNLLEAVLSTCCQLKYLYICKCRYPVTSVISSVRRLRDSGAVPSLETVNFAVDSQIIDGGVYKRIYDPQTLIVDYKVADIPNVIFRMLKSDREALLRREDLGFGEQVYHAAVDIVTGAQSVAQSVFGYFAGYMKK